MRIVGGVIDAKEGKVAISSLSFAVELLGLNPGSCRACTNDLKTQNSTHNC
jgi:hypothetical protein